MSFLRKCFAPTHRHPLHHTNYLIMRILHILNDIRALGNGIINVAVDLACLQAQEGHTVAVASAGGEYENLLSQYGVIHFYLDQRRYPLNLLKVIQSYRKIIDDFQPDVVHAHMMTGIVLAWVLRPGKPYKIVSTVHNEWQRSSMLMGLADHVIAVSQAVEAAMANRGISPAKISTVCNGTLDSPRQSFQMSLEGDRPPIPPSTIPLNRPAIATVAGMYQRKGIAQLIQAFFQITAQFPDAHLYLIGDGPDRAEFEQLARQSTGSERIHFEGFQLYPGQYLQSTDIFVLASLQEPFGLVLSEAREAGCAIVASEVDGIPEVLDRGTAGWLVPPGDIAALAEAIAQLLSDPALLQEWRGRSRQNLEWLSVKRVYRETLEIYQQVCYSWQ